MQVWRVALVVEELLPLPHHAQEPVVQDRDDDRQAVLHRHDELLDVHLDRAVAGDVDDPLVRPRQLRADGRGEAVAHGAQPAGRDEGPGLGVLVELGRPHLVLPHLGADDGVSLRDGGRSPPPRTAALSPPPLVHLVGKGVLLLQLLDLVSPFVDLRGLDDPVHLARARACSRPRWERPPARSC